jgi:hypothetical protein
MRRPFPVSLAVRPALSALGDALTRQILRVGYQPLGYRSAVKFWNLAASDAGGQHPSGSGCWRACSRCSLCSAW